MYRICKIAMGEFSYMLEKYLGITSILPTVIACAVACAVTSAVLFKTAEVIYLKIRRCHERKAFRFRPACMAAAWFFSLIVNQLVSSPQTWDSKVYRVMSNFQYVLSFSSSRQEFLDALLLPDNTVNRSVLFRIAMCLNDEQWLQINRSVDDASWYFSSVEKAIRETVRLGRYHLVLEICEQGLAAYVPVILLAVLGVILIFRNCKMEAAIVLAAALSGIVFSLGGAIALCIAIYGSYLLWIYFGWARQQRGKYIRFFRQNGRHIPAEQ